jgi:hypothetical protein
MASPVMLAIDVVLGALIGPPDSAADMIIARAEAGEWQPVVLDLALYCAMASVREGDRVDTVRFAKLLRYAQLAPSLGRGEDGVLSPPSDAEIEHWRTVALGLQTDDDELS